MMTVIVWSTFSACFVNILTCTLFSDGTKLNAFIIIKCSCLHTCNAEDNVVLKSCVKQRIIIHGYVSQQAIARLDVCMKK